VRSFVVIASCLLFACVAQEQAPETAYRAFARAVAEHDGERAWTFLSADTKAWMDARAKEAAAAAPGVVAPSGERLLVGNAARAARPLTSVVLLRESRDLAVLEVEEEGSPKRSVELVREKGWRIRIQPPA
jgi:hypothetical protein